MLLVAAPAALLLEQGQAKAVITYNIFESGGDVIIKASGSAALPATPLGTSLTPGCFGSSGGINTPLALFCTGSAAPLDFYAISGPTSVDGVAGIVIDGGGSSSDLVSTLLNGSGFATGSPVFGIAAGYISGTPFSSSSVFAGQTLAGLGFTTTGLIGTWTIDGTADSIQVFLSPPAVPGPLPLLGAGAAFGWSRRLRRRIASPSLPSTRA